jgi:hypothetical protein
MACIATWAGELEVDIPVSFDLVPSWEVFSAMNWQMVPPSIFLPVAWGKLDNDPMVP